MATPNWKFPQWAARAPAVRQNSAVNSGDRLSDRAPVPIVKSPMYATQPRTSKRSPGLIDQTIYTPSAADTTPTYTGDGGYGDRLAPYLVDPTAGKAKLQWQIDDLTKKMGGIKQGVSPDQDRMYTTYRDTIRDYGMLLQDLNAYVAKPEMRAGAVQRPQWEPYQQAVDQSTPGYMHDFSIKRGEGQNVQTSAVNSAQPPQTNMPQPAQMPSPNPPVTGTIADAYGRKPRKLPGLLNTP